MSNEKQSYADATKLGKSSEYVGRYDSTILDAVARSAYRKTITGKVKHSNVTTGADIWHAYELSFLLRSGLPQVYIARITLPADSTKIVESKSLKLYLNSFSQTSFESEAEVAETIGKDLSLLLEAAVIVELFDVTDSGIHNPLRVPQLAVQSSADGFDFQQAQLLDSLPVSCDDYQVNAGLLELDEGASVKGCFVSHLLRSNCPITNQPDWASIFIAYDNSKDKQRGMGGLTAESLLKYIVSYRNHNGFHEQTIEQIFSDLLNLGFKRLFVAGRYTRRGGIDINPVRSTGDIFIDIPYVNRL